MTQTTATNARNTTMTTTTAKKITLTTIKSFIKKNRDALQIMTRSQFDGMEDGCRSTGERGFSPALTADSHNSHNLGVHGAWFVLGSRDWFGSFENETHIGYEVSNCCGVFFLAIAK